MGNRLRGLVARARFRGHGDTIPLADAASLAPAARRTRTVRLVLLVALVAAAAGAIATAPNAQGRHFLPSNTVGIVVLDLSSSIRPDTYYRIEHELAILAATRQRFGLVVFSDVAYEALPPGTPASELKPLLRFFSPQNRVLSAGDEQGSFTAKSPWDQWFSSGTNISSGLQLAADVLKREHVQHPAVVLISDLGDDPTDFRRLGDAIVEYAQRQIPLRVVALHPTNDNLRMFARMLGDPSLLTNAKLPTGAEARGSLTLSAGFPVWLAVLGGLVVVLLALNEWWAEPLTWRRAAPS